MSKVLAVNAGSSSLKFKLYEMPEEKVICSGLLERIGLEMGNFVFKMGNQKFEHETPLKDHEIAVKLLVESLIEHKCVESLEEIKGIGHRVVQGGSYFNDSAIFDEEGNTERLIESLIPLAPLHNKAHLVGFRAFKKILPNVRNIAVFDTAFHQTMEEEDYMYPIKYEYYEKFMIRRYGAHGTSHKYLSQEAMKHNANRIISCHIGSGASLCAIKDGKCVATSMGLTPLGGIMMGTRTGDIDASVMNQIVAMTGKSCEEVYQEFNKQSGLVGVSGVSPDSRDIENGILEGNERCKLAYKLYARRIADFIGQYYVRLGGCDMIVFSAGVGENSSWTRRNVINNIAEALGVVIDDEANNGLRGRFGVITKPESKITVVVIPTDEEVMIARDCVRLLGC